MHNYKPFNSFILRTPFLPFNKYLKDSSRFLEEMVSNDYFKESIYLASPDLYKALKLLKENTLSSSKLMNLQLSILKYYGRMSTRCTPFGLFAGCSIGKIGHSSICNIPMQERHKSNTQLDMSYLYSLIKEIEKKQEVFQKIKFSPNRSLHELRNSFRYVSYKYLNSKRIYSLMEVEKSEELNQLLRNAKNGITIKNMSMLLVNNEVIFSDAQEFINELIESQIIISELEPKITNGDLLQNLIDSLDKPSVNENMVLLLKQIKSKLSEIDNVPIGKRIDLYENLKKQLQKFKFDANKKNYFKTDLYINSKKLNIGEDVIDKVKQCISVLNKLTPSWENKELKEFKEKFYKRYEDEEIPLLLALDKESGIGFGNINDQQIHTHQILDDINLHKSSNDIVNIKIDPIQKLLIKKYEDFITNPALEEVSITDNDLKEFPDNWNDLDDTISAMIEIIQVKEEPIIYIYGAGGPSAANPIARFCLLDEKIDKLVKSITQKEKELNQDSIIAEIVHIPNEHLGNVAIRTTIREYEIPYLTNPSVKNKHIINISDLTVSVPNGQTIVLKSKSLNSRIIPKLTTALTYNNYPLPIYQFLCTLQSQDKRNGMKFTWGSILENKPYLPRVVYKKQILSKATWNIFAEEVKEIPKIIEKYFFKKVSELKLKRKLPDIVLLNKGDNKLLINFNDPLSIQMLFSEVKNRAFQLEEFLFNDKNPFVVKKEESFTNQVLLSFYKKYEK